MIVISIYAETLDFFEGTITNYETYEALRNPKGKKSNIKIFLSKTYCITSCLLS